MKMNIGFLRVSGDDQRDQLQRDVIIPYLDTQDRPYELYSEVCSGKAKSRKNFEKLLGMVRMNKIHEIVCYRTDRLCRRFVRSVELAEACKETSTDIVGLSNGLRLKSPSGPLMFNLLAAMADSETETLRERCMDGVKVAKREGKCIGGIGGGWFEARTIQVAPQIRQMKAAGKTQKFIAEYLRLSPIIVRKVLEWPPEKPMLTHQQVYAQLPETVKGKRYHAAKKMLENA